MEALAENSNPRFTFYVQLQSCCGCELSLEVEQGQKAAPPPSVLFALTASLIIDDRWPNEFTQLLAENKRKQKQQTETSSGGSCKIVPGKAVSFSKETSLS